MIKFNKGAPPSVGWWPVTTCPEKKEDNPKNLPHSWWDGKCWSFFCLGEESAESAGAWSYIKHRPNRNIYWCERWWG